MGRLDGKVALISGGARGQGAVEVKLFTQEGAKVVFGDILDAEGKQVEADIRSSGAGIAPAPGTSAAYAASKGGVRLLTKSTAIQHAKDNIRCNSVHPGPIDTPMIRGPHRDASWAAELTSRVPLGRLGSSADIAYGVLYLASDEASFVTGSELVIDGGRTAQ